MRKKKAGSGCAIIFRTFYVNNYNIIIHISYIVNILTEVYYYIRVTTIRFIQGRELSNFRY